MVFDRPNSDAEGSDRLSGTIDRPHEAAVRTDQDAPAHRPEEVLRDDEVSDLRVELAARNRDYQADRPVGATPADSKADDAEARGVYAGTPWEDEKSRVAWIDDRYRDDDLSRPARGAEGPALDYQKQTAGQREVKLSPTDGDGIWADGLRMDPDKVAAVEAKYVEKPGMSIYQGDRPPVVQEMLMRGFDDEMARYGAVIKDSDNPVARLRLVTSTEKAADYLGARAARILGDDVDLDIRVERLQEEGDSHE